MFTYTAITMIDVLDHPLTDAEKHQLYDECKLWYQRYGISDRAMPADWDAFCDYWDDLCQNVLEATPVAQRIVDDVFANPNSLRLPRMPRPVYWLLGPLITDQAMLVTTALAPPAVREKLGLRSTARQRRMFAAETANVRRVWPLLPPPLQARRRVRFGKQRAARLVAG